jgi:hypothetical protein
MNPTVLVKKFLPTALIGLILAGGIWGGQPLGAALALLIVELYLVWSRGGELSEQSLQLGPYWLSSFAVLVIALISPRPGTQIVLIVLYCLWRAWLSFNEAAQPWLVAALTQFLALDALFLGAAVWHWPILLIVILTWAISWVVARQVLAPYQDRAEVTLAATWALVSAECAWVFSLWLVSYIVVGGIIIIPQAAIVLTALGYCLGGIYTSHRRSQLSRNRLIEYLLIGLFLLAIVIAGTKWNGVI